jgi:hypothetical protein
VVELVWVTELVGVPILVGVPGWVVGYVLGVLDWVLGVPGFVVGFEFKWVVLARHV